MGAHEKTHCKISSKRIHHFKKYNYGPEHLKIMEAVTLGYFSAGWMSSR